jgi:hypothetical protein
MKPVTLTTITDDELATLLDYAREIGRKWKEALLVDWYNASAYRSGFTGPYHVLQGLRNRAGAHELVNDRRTTQAALMAEQQRREKDRGGLAPCEREGCARAAVELVCGVAWVNLPQGEDYWRNVYNQLRALAGEDAYQAAEKAHGERTA